MGTTIRPELSTKNENWIDKHRYYELKHFCLQYPAWKKAYISLEGLSKRPNNSLAIQSSGAISDPTAKCAEAKIFYSDRIKLIEDAAMETDEILSDYIVVGVTEGYSYDQLKARLDIPCGRETYYKLYRRFFHILDSSRN